MSRYLLATDKKNKQGIPAPGHADQAAVTAPAALTSVETFNVTYDSTEIDALRADVVAIRAALIATQTLVNRLRTDLVNQEAIKGAA